MLGLCLPLQAGGTLTNATYEGLSAALIGGGLVRFECDGTITLPNPILITVSTVLDAQGHAITLSSSSTNPMPLFFVAPTVPLGLNTVTLTGGNYPLGGAVVNSNGTVWASACTFRGNKATGAAGADGATGADDDGIGQDGGAGGTGGPARGGVFYNYPQGTLQLTNCLFASNSAVGGHGGKGGTGGAGVFQGGDGGVGGLAGDARGGAVFNEGTLVVKDCTFGTNTVIAGDGGAGGPGGGGIWTAAIGDGASGGAALGGSIYNLGTAFVSGSTFHANTLTGGKGSVGGTDAGGEGRDGSDGGAAHGGGCFNEGTAVIVNCTFYANQTTGGAAGDGGAGGWIGGNGGSGGNAQGGGFHNSGAAGVTNCTFAANGLVGGSQGKGGGGLSAGEDGHDGTVAGANVASTQSPLRLRNTILAGTTNLVNASGTIEDGGHNLSSDATPAFQPPGLNNQDPKLGTFGSHGGLTQTISLGSGSPAIGLAAPEAAVPTDQRGVARPAAQPDAGAFERQPVLVAGRVLASGQPVSLTVLLVGYTITNSVATDRNGYFSFVDAAVGPWQVRLETNQSAAYLPPQYNLYLTELSEGQTNLNFYGRAATLAVGSRTSSGLTITGVGVPQTAYRMQAAPALLGSGSAWVTLSTNTADATGSFSITDTNVSRFPLRWYRAVLP